MGVAVGAHRAGLGPATVPYSPREGQVTTGVTARAHGAGNGPLLPERGTTMQTESFESRLSDLKRRGRVRTGYDPREFIELFEDAPGPAEEGEVRELFREIDGGRFHEFLDEAHNVLAHSDLKRQHHFENHYSDRMILWIKAFGTVEELNKFPRISVPSPPPNPYRKE